MEALALNIILINVVIVGMHATDTKLDYVLYARISVATAAATAPQYRSQHSLQQRSGKGKRGAAGHGTRTHAHTDTMHIC